MPDMKIQIGGRPFTVACQDGEEDYLAAAAALLDREAQEVLKSGGRLAPDRMLLMAGLMLADRSISANEELRSLDRRLVEQSKLLEDLQARAPEVREVEREVVRETVPSETIDRLEALARQAEAVAARAREAAERG